jgi:hypothetical protein
MTPVVYYIYAYKLVVIACIQNMRTNIGCILIPKHGVWCMQAVLSDTTVQTKKRRSGGPNTVMVMITATVESDPGTAEMIQRSITQASVAANIPAGSGVSIVNIDSVVSSNGEACLFAKSATLSGVRLLLCAWMYVCM